MESQPQNPEYRNNHGIHSFYMKIFQDSSYSSSLSLNLSETSKIGFLERKERVSGISSGVEIPCPTCPTTSPIHSGQARADPDGGQGVRTPPENHKNIGFLSNTGLDPLINHNATKPAFHVGPTSARQRNTI